MTAKRFYRIPEVSQLLSTPISTLRWWEEVFPMFKPNRTAGGHRRFTKADIKMAGKIKELLHVKGLKVDAAIEMMNKTYRKHPPRQLRLCRNAVEAIALLDEVKAITVDAHAEAKIEAVMKFLSSLKHAEK